MTRESKPIRNDADHVEAPAASTDLAGRARDPGARPPRGPGHAGRGLREQAFAERADHERALVERFRRARRDNGRAVLEGFHALKHAIRFQAAIEQVCATDLDELWALTRQLAPDIEPALGRLVRLVPPKVFAELAPYPPETGVIALARRPQANVTALLEERSAAPVVLLEEPAHLGNLGAVVRVAAAAGAAAVITTGPQDPWHPAALRGAAGLHFALPVARIARPLAHCDRPLVAIHPNGQPLRPGMLPDGAIVAFGSERRGLSGEMLAAAKRQIAIPMRQGVSSLNLASAVAVILYSRRLIHATGGHLARERLTAGGS